MAVRLRSMLASGPMVVPLSSGRTVRLSAGQPSAELDEAEVADNQKVDDLRRRGLLAVEPIVRSAGSEPATAAAAPPATQRKRRVPSE